MLINKNCAQCNMLVRKTVLLEYIDGSIKIDCILYLIMTVLIEYTNTLTVYTNTLTVYVCVFVYYVYILTFCIRCSCDNEA